MVSNRWRIVTWPILVAGLSSPFLMDCGQLGALKDAAGKASALAAGCPDIASIDAVAKADFSKLGLDVEGAAKIKGALTASIALQDLAASIEADLKGACGKLAKDLGADVKADAKAEESCKAAAKAIGDIKAKAGGSFKLSIKPPVCSASMSAMADCAGSCDASASGGKAEVKCEEGKLSGECGAKCEGTCKMEAGGTCSGECSGACEAKFEGKCDGTCKGKCEKKDTKDEKDGNCTGKCEGSCTAGAKDSKCGGTCKGECKLAAGAECKGTCSGKCSVEMKAPKCEGTVEYPKVSADCKAKCDAQVSGKLECSPASVVVKAEGAADAKAAEKLVGALQTNLPMVLKVAVGMAKQAQGAAGNIKAVVEGGQAVVTKVKGANLAKLTACVGGKFTGALDAAASISANVNVSVEVKGSASAEGKAGAK